MPTNISVKLPMSEVALATGAVSRRGTYAKGPVRTFEHADQVTCNRRSDIDRSIPVLNRLKITRCEEQTHQATRYGGHDRMEKGRGGD
jgi:hypothetical protein